MAKKASVACDNWICTQGFRGFWNSQCQTARLPMTLLREKRPLIMEIKGYIGPECIKQTHKAFDLRRLFARRSRFRSISCAFLRVHFSAPSGLSCGMYTIVNLSKKRVALVRSPFSQEFHHRSQSRAFIAVHLRPGQYANRAISKMDRSDRLA